MKINFEIYGINSFICFVYSTSRNSLLSQNAIREKLYWKIESQLCLATLGVLALVVHGHQTNISMLIWVSWPFYSKFNLIFHFYYKCFFYSIERKYYNLCSNCKNPHNCLSGDIYAGPQGSLLCLTEGQGNVAWARATDVLQHFQVHIYYVFFNWTKRNNYECKAVSEEINFLKEK